jgi:nucleoside-diphosphate-sugar epimerase
MNVLVVGGAGYVGGALTDLLLSGTSLKAPFDSYNIRVYDSLLFEDAYRKKVDFVYGDVRNRQRLKNNLDWADCVVWLAAIVGDGACALNPELTDEINDESVKWLAENFDGRIIFMSTCSVYGAQDGMLTEDSPTEPLSIYAATKLKAEEYLKDKNAIIFRLGTLFGVGDQFSRIRTDLVVNVMAARAYYEQRLKVFGGEQWRPLLHVKDAALAVRKAIDDDHTGVYNLCFENWKMLDLANEIAKYLPADIDIVETKFEDSRNYRADAAKAKQDLFFDPKHTIRTGIKELHGLFQEGRIKDWNNPRFSNQAFMEIINATKTN